jgi:hypothetical protein
LKPLTIPAIPKSSLTRSGISRLALDPLPEQLDKVSLMEIMPQTAQGWTLLGQKARYAALSDLRGQG